MPTAELIAIGTELLLGEIQDTNTRFLAKKLRNFGIDIFRATLIGDNSQRIAAVIREAFERSDIVITTGGLGPTVDDPTREAAALAFGVKTQYHPELWEQILERFKKYGKTPTENNRRQAYIPENATGIENPVGTAPSFRIEVKDKVLISLPGVPREMEYLTENSIIPFLQEKYNLYGKIIKARVLHTSGIGESSVDDLIGDLEKVANPTVGLLAHPGQTDVRITAKAESEEQADRMIDEMSKVIYQKLGEFIYGTDQETLQSVVLQALQKIQTSFVLLEAGSESNLSEYLNPVQLPYSKFVTSKTIQSKEELMMNLEQLRENQQAEVGFGIFLEITPDHNRIYSIYKSPKSIKESVHSYGGPPEHVKAWAANYALDFLRRNLYNDTKE